MIFGVFVLAVSVAFSTAQQPDPDPAPATPAQARAAPRARLSGGVLNTLALRKVPPIYPLSAKQAGLQGTVVLHVIVSKNGKVVDLAPVSGPEDLRGAAIDAVRQWRYKPYLLNGNPVEIESSVLINFRLGN